MTRANTGEQAEAAITIIQTCPRRAGPAAAGGVPIGSADAARMDAAGGGPGMSGSRHVVAGDRDRAPRPEGDDLPAVHGGRAGDHGQAGAVDGQPGVTDMHRPAAEAVYAFRAQDGTWFGPHDALPARAVRRRDAALRPGPAGRRVRRPGAHHAVRAVGPGRECPCLPGHPAGQGCRVASGFTHAVLDFLFGDGQTPLRQAMTALVNAGTLNPLVPAAAAFGDGAEQAGEDVELASWPSCSSPRSRRWWPSAGLAAPRRARGDRHAQAGAGGQGVPRVGESSHQVISFAVTSFRW